MKEVENDLLDSIDIIDAMRKEKIEVGHCKDEYIKYLEKTIMKIMTGVIKKEEEYKNKLVPDCNAWCITNIRKYILKIIKKEV
jgi:hypothetical protein